MLAFLHSFLFSVFLIPKPLDKQTQFHYHLISHLYNRTYV